MRRGGLSIRRTKGQLGIGSRSVLMQVTRRAGAGAGANGGRTHRGAGSPMERQTSSEGVAGAGGLEDHFQQTERSNKRAHEPARIHAKRGNDARQGLRSMERRGAERSERRRKDWSREDLAFGRGRNRGA